MTEIRVISLLDQEVAHVCVENRTTMFTVFTAFCISVGAMKKVSIKTHPSLISLQNLTGTPVEIVKTLKGQVEKSSLALAATKDELIQEIIFMWLAVNYKTDALVDLIRLDRIKTLEDIITYINAEQRKGIKRPRSKSRERSQSCSGCILDVCGGDGHTISEGEEKIRLRTRSRRRAVRISFEGVEPEPTVFEEEPSTEAPEPSSAAKRWLFFCKYCGE